MFIKDLGQLPIREKEQKSNIIWWNMKKKFYEVLEVPSQANASSLSDKMEEK